MDHTFDSTPDTVYLTLQSHAWYVEDFQWWGARRVHWDFCNPLCGCEQMTIRDIAYLLPHHQLVPPSGYVIQYPVDYTRTVNPAVPPNTRPNTLTTLASRIVQNQLEHFFRRAHYAFWHFSDFKHAQMVLKNDHNVPPAISYALLPSLDHDMCWCWASPNEIIRNFLDRIDKPEAPAFPEPDW